MLKRYQPSASTSLITSRTFIYNTNALRILNIFVSGQNSLGKRSNQFPAEIRDILNHASPDHMSFAESCLIDPDASGVGDIILDACRANRFAPLHDACRDGNPAAVTDGANDLALRIHVAHELEDFLITAQFIGCPAAWNNKAVELVSFGCFVNAHIGCHLQAVLAAHGSGRQADYDDPCSLFAQTHDGNPEL